MHILAAAFLGTFSLSQLLGLPLMYKRMPFLYHSMILPTRPDLGASWPGSIEIDDQATGMTLKETEIVWDMQ